MFIFDEDDGVVVFLVWYSFAYEDVIDEFKEEEKGVLDEFEDGRSKGILVLFIPSGVWALLFWNVEWDGDEKRHGK